MNLAMSERIETDICGAEFKDDIREWADITYGDVTF